MPREPTQKLSAWISKLLLGEWYWGGLDSPEPRGGAIVLVCQNQPRCLFSTAFVHSQPKCGKGCSTKHAVVQQELTLALSERMFPVPSFVVRRPERFRAGSGPARISDGTQFNLR